MSSCFTGPEKSADWFLISDDDAFVHFPTIVSELVQPLSLDGVSVNKKCDKPLHTLPDCPVQNMTSPRPANDEENVINHCTHSQADLYKI